MTAACPSDLAFERYLLGRAPEVEAHLGACAGCAARLAEMRREGDEFRRAVYPRTVDRIEEAAQGRSPRRWLRLLLVPAPALAAALAAVLLVGRSGPDADYLGTKGGGGAIGLTAFARSDAGVRPVADGADVAAGATLRLRVRTGAACRLVILSVDGAGHVSRLDGSGDEGLALQAGQHDLPGGVELEGGAGPERLFAVCAPAGLDCSALEEAARAAASGGDADVRRASALAGIPRGTPQATLLLEKRL
jgi:hypothetical protein